MIFPSFVASRRSRRAVRLSRGLQPRRFIALSSRQGEIVLAANAVLLNFMQLAAFGLDGFAFATEAMVGRQVGAGSHAGFRAAVRAGFVWSLPLAAALAAAFALAGPIAIRLMTGIPEVRSAADLWLPWLIAAPLVSVSAFMFDGVFLGATRARDLRNAMALALAVFLVAAWSLPPAFGNHGLWMALLLLNAARGVILALLFAHLERRRGFVGG